MGLDNRTGQYTRPTGICEPAGILFAVFLICCVSIVAGCVSASASRSVQDWNAWSTLQQKFSQQVGSTLKTLDEHHAVLNTAIISGNPDITSLRKNLDLDKDSLDLWKSQMMALDSAATRFFTNASHLNGTAFATAQRMDNNIGVYLQNMNAARGELNAYCIHLDQYLSEGDLNYADDSQRVAADAARERALVYLKQADDALGALDEDAKVLERAQTVI